MYSSILTSNKYKYKYKYNKLYRVDSMINFDVNPSVELKINKAVPLNKDDKIVLNDIDLEKVDLDVAVNAIIGSVLDQAYYNDKEANKLANENDISEGKARLINNILATKMNDRNGHAYTFEALSKLSINELNLLINAKKAEIKDENTSTQGIASENYYIVKEKAKNIAFKNTGVSSNKVKKLKVEMDADDGKIVYDIDFIVDNIEYEYEINAKTGEIIEKDIEKNNIKTKNNWSNDNYQDDDDGDRDDD